MNILLRIAVQEYRRNVFKRSFIMVLLSVPLLLGLALGSGVLVTKLSNKDLPVGYIDQAQIIKTTTLPKESNQEIAFTSFQNQEQAKAALETGKIQAYLVILPDYMKDKRVDIVYKTSPGDQVYSQIYDLFQYNLLIAQPQGIAIRATVGNNLLVRTINGEREFDPSAPTFDLILPLFIGFSLVYMLMISSGYLMSAIAEEKENRTMEVIISSVSPGQFISGKVIGTLGISLTLIFAWTAVAVIGISAARSLGMDWFQMTNPPWKNILTVLLIGIPTYVLASALMTAIGATVTSTQEGQAVAGIFIIAHLLPIYLTGFMIEDSNHPLVIALSLAPFTSLLGSCLRQLFGYIPNWQIALAVGTQAVFAVIGIWLAGRALRIGMLRYGQRLSWKNLLKGQTEIVQPAQTQGEETIR